MRILNILPYSPCPPHFGGALRIYHLLREMARVHEVTVVMYGTPGQGDLVRATFGKQVRAISTVEKPRKLNGASKRLAQVRSLFSTESATTESYYSDAMQEAIDKAVSRTSFDLVQMENHPFGLFRIDCPGAPRVMDTQNVEHDNMRRMANATYSPIRRVFYTREYRKLYLEEKTVYEQQDAVLVTSMRDKTLMDADFPRVPKYVIPNGVDTSFFTPQPESTEPHALVFTGAMNYFPNVDGIVYFLKEIFPLVLKQVPDARVYIVGGGPTKQLTSLAAHNIIITGFVADVRPFVQRSGVYVVPLRMGGGTRLKVLEALAMEKPVVTTHVGCEGINVEDRSSALIADDPGAFAASVIELMRNRELCRTLVRNGREIIRAEYEWSVIGKKLNDVYGSILARRSAPQPSMYAGSTKIMAKS